MATQENTIMASFDDKHYELLASNIKRYLQNVPESVTLIELGKAINMIVEMVEHESMRDSRQERNS